MLLDEFIPLVESHVGTQPRALLGWSMGGYGALLAAETVPSRFRAVSRPAPPCSRRPHRPRPARSTAPPTTTATTFTRGTERLASLTVRVDCGTSDPFYEATRKFVAELHPAPQGTFGKGFHDDAYWRSVAPAQIATISHALRRD